jgi:hypothetical protein
LDPLSPRAGCARAVGKKQVDVFLPTSPAGAVEGSKKKIDWPLFGYCFARFDPEYAAGSQVHGRRQHRVGRSKPAAIPEIEIRHPHPGRQRTQFDRAR